MPAELAREIAETELPPWDHGLAWGGLLLSSRCAVTHFCVVGAPGSGKTLLIRLLMQSALPRIGKSAKTKDYTRTVELPAVLLPALPEPEVEETPVLPPAAPPVAWHPFLLAAFAGLAAAICLYFATAQAPKLSLATSAWGIWALLLGGWAAWEYRIQSLALSQFRSEQQASELSAQSQRVAQSQQVAPPRPVQLAPETRIETLSGPEWGKHRALVYDAKQDVMSILHGMHGVDCPIYTLNPFDTRCAAWDMAQDITAPATAQQIANILIPDNPNASQPFFYDAARHLLTGVFIALMKKAGKNWEFRDVLIALKSRDNIVALLGSLPETVDLIEQYLPDNIADRAAERDTTGRNVMATVRTKIAPFEFVAAAWSHAEHKVSLKDWLQNEYILVLGNDEAHRSALDAINRVIFKRLSELVLSLDETETARTWIFLDEAREAGNLDGLGSLMTKGRSKGAAVVLGFQDMEGMRESFGVKRANEIVAMCASKAILRLESPETARWASDMFGEFEAYEDKQGWSQGQGETVGESDTTGTSMTRGTNTSKGVSVTKDISREVLSISENLSTGESYSDTHNSSRSTSASQSRNWNESLNRERVRRAALLPSQFMSLPATNPRNGLTGYFVSPFTGAYQTHIAGELLGRWLNAPDPDFPNVLHRHDSHQYIRPWDESDLKRLNIEKKAPTAQTSTVQAPTSGTEPAQEKATSEQQTTPAKEPAPKNDSPLAGDATQKNDATSKSETPLEKEGTGFLDPFKDNPLDSAPPGRDTDGDDAGEREDEDETNGFVDPFDDQPKKDLPPDNEEDEK